MLKFIANLSMLFLGVAYFGIAHTFYSMMESTKIADLGYNNLDIACLVIASIFGLAGCFNFSFVAYNARD